MAVSTEEKTEGDDKDASHRLFGIFVKEVSLVDRAANKRTFLVTKRDTTPMAKANKAAASVTTKTAAAVAKAPEQGSAETAADAAGAPPGGGPDGAGAPTQGGEGAPAEGQIAPMQPAAKDQLLQAITGLASKLVDIADDVKDAPTDDKADGPAVPASILGQLTEVSQALAGMLAQAGAPPADAGAAAAPTKDLEGLSENGGVDAQGSQKLAKAGRKMAKERLSRLANILSSLSGIYRELNTEKSAKVSKAAAPAAPIISHADLASLLEGFDELVTKRDQDAKMLADLATQNAEMRKRVGAPNSLGTDTSPETRVEKSVSWPLDLNARPRAVTPSTSFGVAGERR